jgi:hypothetical protein
LEFSTWRREFLLYDIAEVRVDGRAAMKLYNNHSPFQIVVYDAR